MVSPGFARLSKIKRRKRRAGILVRFPRPPARRSAVRKNRLRRVHHPRKRRRLAGAFYPLDHAVLIVFFFSMCPSIMFNNKSGEWSVHASV